MVSQYILTKLLLITNKTLINFTEKPGRTHPNWMVEVNSTITGTREHCVAPDRMHWGHSITSGVFLTKMLRTNLIVRKHQTNPKWGTACKMIALCSSKISRLWKAREDGGNVPGWKRPKRHNDWMQCIIMCFFLDQKWKGVKIFLLLLLLLCF